MSRSLSLRYFLLLSLVLILLTTVFTPAAATRTAVKPDDPSNDCWNSLPETVAALQGMYPNVGPFSPGVRWFTPVGGGGRDAFLNLLSKERTAEESRVLKTLIAEKAISWTSSPPFSRGSFAAVWVPWSRQAVLLVPIGYCR